uniref:Uncharacterized protein n=1 Tax=Hyaloperonospora arabidopsidis (strain Emoy2) TaxID=559515 RepID=M4BL42_HYAAE
MPTPVYLKLLALPVENFYKLCLSGFDGRHNPTHAGTHLKTASLDLNSTSPNPTSMNSTSPNPTSMSSTSPNPTSMNSTS